MYQIKTLSSLRTLVPGSGERMRISAPMVPGTTIGTKPPGNGISGGRGMKYGSVARIP